MSAPRPVWWRLHGLALLAVAALLAAPASRAQLAEKPSVYDARRHGEKLAAPAHPNRTAAALESVGSRAEFASIARIFARGTAREILHVPFVVDRRQGRVYYLNTNRYQTHEAFLRGEYIVESADRKTIASSYGSPTRRFIFGTAGYASELGRWSFEFWEGDLQTGELLGETARRLAASFFAPLVFKANSAQQEEVATAAGVEAVTEAQILGRRTYLPLNKGAAVGRLRLVADLAAEGEDDIEPGDIVVLREVPLALPPVAGVVTERPSTVLSHVNLLAKGWGIPNAYVKDAFAVLQPLDRQWVRLRVGDNSYSIEPSERPARAGPAAARKGAVRTPDLQRAAALPLAQMRRASAASCGGKAATLGEIEHDRRLGLLHGIAEVPDGFCLPFAQYAAFMRRADVRARVDAALASEGFSRSRVVRRRALETLRGELAALPVDAAIAAAWVGQWQAQLGGRGAFVRSSSNAEDLPNFSGAGLFSTVPNVTRAGELIKAVQTVWASVFNFEAFEARRQAGIASDAVFMGVFVQVAIDSATSGVMITRDPFDATRRGVVYVSAKRGIGIKVVEGRRVAEQSMFHARSNAVRRLSRSEEDSALRLGAEGGGVEQAVTVGQTVLSDAQVRALARVGERLKALLGGVEQDVEWAFDPGGRIVVLQSRPFIERTSL